MKRAVICLLKLNYFSFKYSAAITASSEECFFKNSSNFGSKPYHQAHMGSITYNNRIFTSVLILIALVFDGARKTPCLEFIKAKVSSLGNPSDTFMDLATKGYVQKYLTT